MLLYIYINCLTIIVPQSHTFEEEKACALTITMCKKYILQRGQVVYFAALEFWNCCDYLAEIQNRRPGCLQRSLLPPGANTELRLPTRKTTDWPLSHQKCIARLIDVCIHPITPTNPDTAALFVGMANMKRCLDLSPRADYHKQTFTDPVAPRSGGT